MSGIKFRPARGFASGDGQAFALTFSDIQAIAGPSGQFPPRIDREFSALVVAGGNRIGPTSRGHSS